MSESATPAPVRDTAASSAATRSPAKARDRAAERALYDQHVDRVFRLALRMTDNVALAEDLTQDVFIRVFERLHQFRGESGFGTWVPRVAISVILNAVKKRNTTATRELPLQAGIAAASRSGELELDVRDRVRAAVAQLPDDLRVIVLLHDVEGYRITRLAGGLGGALLLVTLALLVYMRRIARSTRQALAQVESQISSQHATLASGIDAIAVEVERLGEGQRFMSRVLSKGDQVRAGEATT